MLKSAHAVLIVGADYYEDQNGLIIKKLYILDPAFTGSENTKIKTILSIEICSADIFISY
jgi:hypothetical protein